MRVALIGFGYAGRVFHAPLIAATRGLELTVIGTRRSPAETGYPEAVAIPDPLPAVRHPEADLVVLATPNDTHAPLAEAALRAGKHVVVDKPFTVTPDEARGLAALAAERERVLSVFQNRRWDSDFLGIREAIAGGEIGEVVEIRSEMSRYRPEVRDRWRERPGPGSGVWFDLGPHLVDQAMVLFGPPETVTADLRIQRPGAGAVDWFHAVLGYGRTRVILSASMLAVDTGARWTVRGTEGSLVKLRWDPQESQLNEGMQPGASAWGRDADPLAVHRGDGREEMRPVPDGDYPAYYAAVRDGIQTGGEPPVTAAQACGVMAVLEAGIRSSAEGRTVAPELTEAEVAAWAPAVRFDSKNRSAPPASRR